MYLLYFNCASPPFRFRQRSYFIRIYDVTKSQKVWEQELYNGFNYVANMKPFFHFFEADEGFAGLNFASEQEANKFKGIGEGNHENQVTTYEEPCAKLSPLFLWLSLISLHGVFLFETERRRHGEIGYASTTSIGTRDNVLLSRRKRTAAAPAATEKRGATAAAEKWLRRRKHLYAYLSSYAYECRFVSCNQFSKFLKTTVCLTSNASVLPQMVIDLIAFLPNLRFLVPDPSRQASDNSRRRKKASSIESQRNKLRSRKAQSSGKKISECRPTSSISATLVGIKKRDFRCVYFNT